MASIFDYLRWRGDLPLNLVPLNPVDGILLSRLSYLPFELYSRSLEHDSAPLKDVAAALLALPELEVKALRRADIRLLREMGESPRFRDLPIFRYVKQFDPETQTQFSAVSIGLGSGRTFVSFRGTDNTLVGWKEDFNMSFVCPVPAQQSAADYFAQVARDTAGSFLLGGHSKGGNLAVYAAAFCPPELEERIEAAYNFDGPGFQQQVLQTEGYRRVCRKIHTYVPQSSIIGMLLEHEETYSIVHSTQSNGILQHSVYSWEVQRDGFRLLDTVTNSSRFIDFMLKEWIARMDMTQREAFVDTVYDILTRNNIQTLSALREHRFATAKLILTSVRHLDDPTRKLVTGALIALIRSTKHGLLQTRQQETAHSAPVRRSHAHWKIRIVSPGHGEKP